MESLVLCLFVFSNIQFHTSKTITKIDSQSTKTETVAKMYNHKADTDEMFEISGK